MSETALDSELPDMTGQLSALVTVVYIYAAYKGLETTSALADVLGQLGQRKQQLDLCCHVDFAACASGAPPRGGAGGQSKHAAWWRRWAVATFVFVAVWAAAFGVVTGTVFAADDNCGLQLGALSASIAAWQGAKCSAAGYEDTVLRWQLVAVSAWFAACVLLDAVPLLCAVGLLGAGREKKGRTACESVFT